MDARLARTEENLELSLYYRLFVSLHGVDLHLSNSPIQD